ncbi:phospholipase D-like domain-containing protein [Nocardioides sp. R-C-SC26]|uniref:phospholipase D-like domain-containing protein n=1 Tax=Nocardioides sp. R-C-SC26 TaxID=2870414 RepID=UPI001E63827C|nr:phospholipase D-like domain-containing protein [Nocardioides sp. R-C-SC26]
MRAVRLTVGAVVLAVVATLATVPPQGVAPGAAAAQASSGWTPPGGVLFSDPYSADSRNILRRVIKTIRNTGKGQYIRIAVWNFDDGPTREALINADKRGVHVQVIVAGSVENANYTALAKQLNLRRNDESFARKCKGACRSRSKIMHSKVFLFSRVRSTKHISMFGSSNLTAPAGNRQWNDMVTTFDTPLYNYFVGMFNEYAADKPAKKVFQRVDLGKYRAYLFPTNGRNPVLEELKLVRCTGAKGMPRQRTRIRIAIAGWFDEFGADIARRVRTLWEQGCDIKIITTLAGRSVNRILKAPRGRGPVPIRRLEVDANFDGVAERYLHMKNVAIAGNFDGDRRGKVIITGSPNWSARAARSDEMLVRMSKVGGMVFNYQRWIDKLYASPYSHTRTPAQTLDEGDFDARRRVAPVSYSPRELYKMAHTLPSWYELD